MTFTYSIPSTDFSQAGAASTDMKKKLQALGIDRVLIKRFVIALYEAEMNAAVYGNGGVAEISVDDKAINILVKDNGTGIADIEKALQEGYSTADKTIQELGFGAGMGFSNMKKNTDTFHIESSKEKGTVIKMSINLI